MPLETRSAGLCWRVEGRSRAGRVAAVTPFQLSYAYRLLHMVVGDALADGISHCG